MRIPRSVAFLAVAALLAALGWRGWTLLPVEASVVVSSRGSAVEAVYATGVVEPVAWARVGPLATGRIASILARDGDEVRAGEVLARLDDREALARLAELEARAAYWREELGRQAQLADRGFASRDARERAQSEFLQVVAAIAAQRQRIGDLALVAPMDGSVLRQDGEVGETVDARTVLFWIGRGRCARRRMSTRRTSQGSPPARMRGCARMPSPGRRCRAGSRRSRPRAIRWGRPSASASRCRTTRRCAWA